MFSQTGVDDLANTPVGTGPYIFDNWVKGSAITMTRNDDYWGTAPSVGTMELRYFSDPTAMNSALLSGGIQVMSTVQTPEALSQFDDTTKYQVIDGTTTGEVMLSMNNTEGSAGQPAGPAGDHLRAGPAGHPEDGLGRLRHADRHPRGADRPVVLPVDAYPLKTALRSLLRVRREIGRLGFSGTTAEHTFSFSRPDFARVLPVHRPSLEQRAQGKPGAGCTRRSRAPEHAGIPHAEAHGQGLQVQPRHPGFPHAMVLRLIRALPGERRLLSPLPSPHGRTG